MFFPNKEWPRALVGFVARGYLWQCNPRADHPCLGDLRYLTQPGMPQVVIVWVLCDGFSTADVLCSCHCRYSLGCCCACQQSNCASGSGYLAVDSSCSCHHGVWSDLLLLLLPLSRKVVVCRVVCPALSTQHTTAHTLGTPSCVACLFERIRCCYFLLPCQFWNL